MKQKKGIKFLPALMMIGLVPLFVTVFAVAMVASNKLSSSLEESTYTRLHACAISVQQYFEWDIAEDILDPLDEASLEFIDSLESDEIELTLFGADERLTTSIKDSSNPTGRNVGTKSDPAIWATVQKGNEYRAKGVSINGTKYYVYYVPVYDQDGKVWGMGFAGEKEATVKDEVKSAVTFVIIISVVLSVCFGLIVMFVALKIIKSTRQTETAIATLASGDVHTEVVASSNVTELINIIESTKSLRSNLYGIVSNIHTEVASLNQVMDAVSNMATTCNEAKDGITGAVEELAKGSMEMAESVQNTASSMSEIGMAIEEISTLAEEANSNAATVNTISGQAKENLDNLIHANKSTVDISEEVARGIMEAGVAVEEISKAAQVITDIATQTNLLSLNASIEAARAGEAGRGFAVVAGEISNLAAQSDASAKEIQNVIKNIVEKSNQNTVLANKIKESVGAEGEVLTSVNDSFEKVTECIQTTTGNIDQISQKAGYLDRSKNSVLDEVSTLSSISEENAASTQETNASVEELGANIETISNETIVAKEAADKVAEQIGFFKI